MGASEVTASVQTSKTTPEAVGASEVTTSVNLSQKIDPKQDSPRDHGDFFAFVSQEV